MMSASMAKRNDDEGGSQSDATNADTKLMQLIVMAVVIVAMTMNHGIPCLFRYRCMAPLRTHPRI